MSNQYVGTAMTEPSQFLIYQSKDGRTKIDVMLDAETLWLNQNQEQLTELFGKAKGTISEHIKHIFEDGELAPAATVWLFRTVQSEGAREVVREVEHYNLGMVATVKPSIGRYADLHLAAMTDSAFRSLTMKIEYITTDIHGNMPS